MTVTASASHKCHQDAGLLMTLVARRRWDDGRVTTPAPTTGSMARRILALAVPALGALIAQPLFVLTDTAMVGHLGETVLAGMSIGSTIISTVVGLMVFLAYTTTPMVARRLGAGDKPGAVRAGIDGMWLGLGIGVVLLLGGLALAHPTIAAFTSDPGVAQAALSYLTVSMWGLPGMLIVIAATGLLRGLQDTKTPLVIAVIGAIVNAGLNYVFIYPAGLGIAGSALGTAVTETLMAVAYVVIAMRAATAYGVSLAPGIGDPRSMLTASALMMLRTVTLRISLLMLVWSASALGVTELAAFQITYTIYNLLAFALDALAIAAQAMVGHDLGAGQAREVKRLTFTLCWWGAGVGVVLGALMSLFAPIVGPIFVSEPSVLAVLPAAIWTMSVFLPLCGIVFVLDGVLIGAGDVRYLAWAGIVPMVAFGIFVWLLISAAPTGATALIWLWIAFGGGFMTVRGATLVFRALTDRWLVTGVK